MTETPTVLALRTSRRAIGAAILESDALALFDGRHLSGKRDVAERTAVSFLERLVSTQVPRGCVIFAPDERHDSPTSILRVVQAALVKSGISLRIVRSREMLGAFGRPPLRNRRELQEVTSGLLPQLREVRGAVKPYVVEAAAVALYAQSMLALLAGAK